MDFFAASFPPLIVFLLGASIGSFLNVVIYRLPARLSLLHPPSRCPKCLQRLKFYDNVPILGWLWLKGRCRHCRAAISIRYPLVEGATGLLFLFTFWAFDWPLPMVGYWILFASLLALAIIDLDTMTLPNGLTQFGLLAGLGFQAAVGGQLGLSLEFMVPQVMVGAIGAVVGLWLFEGIALLGSILLGKTAMGGGDAKLAAMIGAWLGWQQVLLTSFLACALGAVVGGLAIALKLRGRRQPLPFGPFLAIGAFLTVLWGEALVATYLRLFFPLGLV